MMYIKVDENGNPVEFPITEENVKYLVGSKEFTEEDVIAVGLRQIKNYIQPDNVNEYQSATRGDIIKNDLGEIEQLWNIVELPVEEKVRRWILGPRQFKLIMTDWTQARDCPLSEEKIAEWAVYRAELRNMTDTLDLAALKSAEDVVWPVPPGTIAPEENWTPAVPEPTPAAPGP